MNVKQIVEKYLRDSRANGLSSGSSCECRLGKDLGQHCMDNYDENWDCYACSFVILKRTRNLTQENDKAIKAITKLMEEKEFKKSCFEWERIREKEYVGWYYHQPLVVRESEACYKRQFIFKGVLHEQGWTIAR